jgi:hypothetical protein
MSIQRVRNSNKKMSPVGDVITIAFIYHGV